LDAYVKKNKKKLKYLKNKNLIKKKMPEDEEKEVKISPRVTYEVDLPENCGIMCREIHPRFKYYIVKVNDKTIKEGLRYFQEDSKNLMLTDDILQNLLKYSDDELSDHHAQNTQEWQDWCDDVLLLVCNVFVRSGGKVPIPVVNMSDFPIP
jgi:hypothetical protein